MNCWTKTKNTKHKPKKVRTPINKPKKVRNPINTSSRSRKEKPDRLGNLTMPAELKFSERVVH